MERAIGALAVFAVVMGVVGTSMMLSVDNSNYASVIANSPTHPLAIACITKSPRDKSEVYYNFLRKWLELADIHLQTISLVYCAADNIDQLISSLNIEHMPAVLMIANRTVYYAYGKERIMDSVFLNGFLLKPKTNSNKTAPLPELLPQPLHLPARYTESIQEVLATGLWNTIVSKVRTMMTPHYVDVATCWYILLSLFAVPFACGMLLILCGICDSGRRLPQDLIKEPLVKHDKSD